MSKITSPIKYDKTLFMYAASRALERAAYYGMRSIVAIYMFRGVLSFSEGDTMQLYGWLIQGIVVAGVIGALFGDFVLGNRKALLVGTVLMSIGLFLLCVPSKAAFYSAIGLIVMGNGLYTPNLLARFGKQFYNKPELTDGGFSILYVLVNIGAFAGITIVGLFGYENYALGFALSGILMLGSAILSFLNKETDSNQTPTVVTYNNSYSALIILGTILATGLYWYLYDFSSNGLYYIQSKIAEFNTDLSPMRWQNLSTSLTVIIGIAVAVIYSFYCFGRTLKLALGFLLTALALGIALFISFPISLSGVGIMFLVVLLMSIAEMIMAPVVYGLITKRANPKYLALLISLTFVPFMIFKALMPYIIGETMTTETKSLMIGAPLMAIMGIVAFVIWIVKKKQNPAA